MSLEAKIEELTGTVAALSALMERTAVNQERLLAGQEKAIEAVKAGNPSTATTRGRKKAAEADTSSAPADTASQAEGAETASEGNAAAETAKEEKPAAAASTIKFGDAAKKWLDKAEKGTDEYKSRGSKIMAILGNFGAGKMSEVKDEDEAKAMFFLKRTVKGLPVTFDAAYDFEGSFDQDEPVAAEPEAAASDDDDDMFG